MRTITAFAVQEIRHGLRNRWVAAAILLLAGLSLSLALLGSAPIGTVKASPLSVTAASLASLSVYLLPLIALMLAYDAVVGESERGTMLLLLAYPVARWQVILGKYLGHCAILLIAIVIGYGGAALLIVALSGGNAGDWQAYLALMASSMLLGAAFVGLGYLVSTLVRERATAAGLAIGLWLLLVVLYDLALLGLLMADQNQSIGQGLFTALMLANPTDAYRILNLTGFEGVRQVTGMAGLFEGAAPGVGVLLASLGAWLVVPLAAATFIFTRREF